MENTEIIEYKKKVEDALLIEIANIKEQSRKEYDGSEESNRECYLLDTRRRGVERALEVVKSL